MRFVEALLKPRATVKSFAGKTGWMALIWLMSTAMVAQTTLVGFVKDGDTGEPMFSANVTVDGTSQGVMTDFDGRFSINVASLPVTLNVSFIGYSLKQVQVTKANQRIDVKLIPDQVLIETAEVLGERISDKQKQSPLTVETMDALAIKEAPTGSFYEGLGNLKGVDLTSASLGFKIVNTRGFNSTSPVRSLQLIDGVDNQSPGLNFSLGNFLGAPDLDVKTVEIVAGASSAYFGPGAFNGVINMETKDPFVFGGLSASYRMGERNLNEWGFRWADSFDNKDGDAVFAYKINAFAFSAYDWEANNYGPVDGSLVDASNPGRFDAVNIYGDEYRSVLDFSGDNSVNARGLGTIYRTGYREVDLVDYDTENLKLSLNAKLRIKPELKYDSPTLTYAANYGSGTTVYQGDNRFSLRGIQFFQNRFEFEKKNNWSIRLYRTAEDAGNSYDPYATALKLQDNLVSDTEWQEMYYEIWVDSISPLINDSYPDLEIVGFDTLWIDPPDIFTLVPVAGYPPGSQSQWYENNAENLNEWHGYVEDLVNQGVVDASLDDGVFLLPGSEPFGTLFESLVSRKNNEGEGGTRFYDKSALTHVSAEKIFKPWWANEIRIGANGRRYSPDSDGTIFSDTNNRVITNDEIGIYAGFTKLLREDQFRLTATIRADKNQNFSWVFSPAASLVWSPSDKDVIRLSFSSAVRNPTLADQYLFLDVGPATLVGNLDGRDSLVTVDSFEEYRRSPTGWNSAFDPTLLEYFNIAPLRPEQVRTLECGYRATILDKIYVDWNYYFSFYRHFIGYNIGLDLLYQNAQFPTYITGVDVFRYAANSNNEVTTQGTSLGVNYYINDKLTCNGNYSWNKLVKTDVDDPIIPAFNTPEHKFNLGLTARGLKAKGKNNWGFSLNYRWVQGFVFEGSPQFTGFVPSYDLLDGQVNYKFDAQGLTVKAGASNLLKNEHIETYGGPTVGRLAYISFAMEL
ncbi:MAG: hypothetical protein CBC05_04745 [Crocinitomicaceae bacterium TMED45]|nr:MAG: hypothetical protein CBC05_04745 [Crocinitomicaceae bacterium TMED45]